jgi:hypothetical protein
MPKMFREKHKAGDGNLPYPDVLERAESNKTEPVEKTILDATHLLHVV